MNNEEVTGAAPPSADMGVVSDKDKTVVAESPVEKYTNAIFVDSDEAVMRQSSIDALKLMPVITDMDYRAYFDRPLKAVSQPLLPADATTQWRNISIWPKDYASWYSNKLQGVYAFRASLKVRIVVNANRMQSGIFRFRAVPVMATDSPLAFANGQHNAYLLSQTSMSTLPGFDIDLACSHTGEITLPWIFPEAACRESSEQRWALCLSQYIPFASGDSGSNSITYTMYLSHPDFESYGSSGTVTFQSGRVKKAEEKEAGIFTRTLAKTSESLGHLTKIPVVGSYMSFLSTTALSLSRAAGVWGWASQPIYTPHHRMVPETIGSMTITNQPKVVRSFGLQTNSATPEGKPVGPQIDELAISNIVSKYAWYRTFSWDDQAQGDVLMTESIDPFQYFSQINTFTGVGNTYPRYIYTPLTYVSRMFGTWRGTIKFRFDIARTQFHSGRIAIVYSPSTSTPVDNQFTYRKVVDVTEASHFEFEVPYVIPNSLQVGAYAAGTLRVLVVDALQAPTGVRRRVNIAVSVAGGHDFTLSNYLGRIHRSVIEPAPCEKLGPGFTYQSGCFRDTPSHEEDCKPDQFDLANTGTVERSFRSLLRAEHPLYYITRPAGVSTLGTGMVVPGVDASTYTLFNPHSEYLLPPASFGGDSVNATFAVDLYSALAPLFYASKGGVRWRMTDDVGVSRTARIAINQNYAVNNVYSDAGWQISSSNFGNVTTRASHRNMRSVPEHSVLLEFPQMTNKPFRKTISNFSVTAPALQQDTNPDTQQQVFVCTGNNGVMLHRSTAEDFDFMLFLGVPIQVVVQSPLVNPLLSA